MGEVVDINKVRKLSVEEQEKQIELIVAMQAIAKAKKERENELRRIKNADIKRDCKLQSRNPRS